MAPKPILALAAFLLAALLSVIAAQGLARVVESRSAEAVTDALVAAGHDWAQVQGDGLQVVIEGTAPDEAARFAALSTAGTQVDAARVIDAMRVAAAQDLPAPEFTVELLRGDTGIQIAGLIPASADREQIAADLTEGSDGAPVTDLLETADYPAPDGWEPALMGGLALVERLERAKISVAPGRVTVEAVADTPEAGRRLGTELRQLVPSGVALSLDIATPRPVIAPFALRMRLADGVLAVDACAADSPEARDAIAAAAAAAGLAGPLDCTLGLGAPGAAWGAAAANGLAALAAIGGGTLTMTDSAMRIDGVAGTDPATFDTAMSELSDRLPGPFFLDAVLPESAAATGPASFTARLGDDGIRLGGPLADTRVAEAVRTLAQARFGAEAVMSQTRVAPDGLPDGWTERVLVGLEAMAHLGEGTLTVTPDALTLAGRTGEQDGRDAITREVLAALGPNAGLALDVTYDEALDPIAGLPTPEECLARITTVTQATKITFEAGSANLSDTGAVVVEQVAEILRACADLRLKIAGYTDSQGSEDGNLRLSQTRAEAVLEALRAERVPVSGFEAVGYGEAEPIADNGTEAGREANRRIEFSLIGLPGEPAPGTAPETATPVDQSAAPEIIEGAPPRVPPTRPAD